MKTVLTGQPERLYIEYRDSDDVLVDPQRPRVTIYDPEGDVAQSSAEPTQESVGVYWLLFNVSTAYPTRRGVYQAWWEGYINSAPVYMDEPIYFNVMDRPVIAGDTSQGNSFARQIRNAIGDNFENDWMIEPLDLNYYIQDGVRHANTVFDFGYDVIVSTAGNNKSGRITFTKSASGASTALSITARTWYAAHTVADIMEAQTRINMFGTGNINAGDIKLNLSGGLKEQVGYLRLLKEDLSKLEKDLKINGASGVSLNNYAIADLITSEV